MKVRATGLFRDTRTGEDLKVTVTGDRDAVDGCMVRIATETGLVARPRKPGPGLGTVLTTGVIGLMSAGAAAFAMVVVEAGLEAGGFVTPERGSTFLGGALWGCLIGAPIGWAFVLLVANRLRAGSGT